MLATEMVRRFGFAKGSAISHADDPKSSVEAQNIYYSDGQRLFLELVADPVDSEAEFLHWETERVE